MIYIWRGIYFRPNYIIYYVYITALNRSQASSPRLGKHTQHRSEKGGWRVPGEGGGGSARKGGGLLRGGKGGDKRN